ncbi:hypothetical protein [Methanobrevibacter olleyae]|uniref:Uncharacterized protein n=1 Tax=Methanobrevibacter olleyae TaxID=294671 RepID=A0A126R0P8_METOL|nr:hypothetical protein [Methanobrevibacter olleyae]AMK15943.1 hypothetical protein YLM1_1386 [Methanobrevibacter olleyae]SFL15959.1 hypothetical protein SAMN02910297_00063 [Methanobrevibacter olleyae]
MVELDRDELYKELEEMENDLRLYPIEEGLEDDIIDFINEKELNENEKWDLNNRLEDFFYGAKLKCRKPTYFFTDGFEFYVTEIYIDFRILEHIKKSFPKFNQLSISSEIEAGFSTLSVKLTL